MIEAVYTVVRIIAVLLLAAVTGGLLSGFDRVLSAKMQRRNGPPLFQPFYDVFKLLRKQNATANLATMYYLSFSLFFTAFTVVMFGLGMDLLLCVFAFTLACVFFVISGYSSYSPFSFIGTERELIQIMCYEPMILLMTFGYYQVVGSFEVRAAFAMDYPPVVKLPLIFLGLTYVLTIKLRKSPFDLSMSHHGHQEIVKGITTEFTGVCMAMVEVTHWLETVFALGLVFILFVNSSPVSWVLGAAACILLFMLEIIIDNSFARVKWKQALAMSWIVTGTCGALNLIIINYI